MARRRKYKRGRQYGGFGVATRIHEELAAAWTTKATEFESSAKAAIDLGYCRRATEDTVRAVSAARAAAEHAASAGPKFYHSSTNALIARIDRMVEEELIPVCIKRRND